MDWIIKLLKLVWEQVSPKVREALVNWVKELEKKASETGSPLDDLLVSILKVILGIS